MKKIIAEIDSIAGEIEDFEEPWAFNIVWRLDKVSQQLEEAQTKLQKIAKLSHVKTGILNQYLNDILFLNENESKLKSLIVNANNDEVNDIYKKIKKHFGKLSRKEAVRFIKNVLKNLQ